MKALIVSLNEEAKRQAIKWGLDPKDSADVCRAVVYRDDAGLREMRVFTTESPSEPVRVLA